MSKREVVDTRPVLETNEADRPSNYDDQIKEAERQRDHAKALLKDSQTDLDKTMSGSELPIEVWRAPRVTNIEFSGIKKDQPKLIPKAIKAFNEFMTGRNNIHGPRIYIQRMMNDYDPRTGRFWYPKPIEIPEFLEEEGNWKAMNRELYNLVYQHMPSWLQTLTNEAFPVGYDKELITIKPNDGVGLVFAVFSIIMGIPQKQDVNEDLKILDNAHHTLHTGDPKITLENTILPALARLTSSQHSVKGVSTLGPIITVLENRDRAFEKLTMQSNQYGIKYLEASEKNICNADLKQYISAAITIAKTLNAKCTQITTKEYWASRPYTEAGSAPSEAREKPKSANSSKTKKDRADKGTSGQPSAKRSKDESWKGDHVAYMEQENCSYDEYQSRRDRGLIPGVAANANATNLQTSSVTDHHVYQRQSQRCERCER